MPQSFPKQSADDSRQTWSSPTVQCLPSRPEVTAYLGAEIDWE